MQGFQAHGSLISSYCLLLQLLHVRKLDSLSSQRATIGHVLMTRSTEGHRFPFQGYHPFDPFWFCPSWVCVEIFYGSAIVHFFLPCWSPHFDVTLPQDLFAVC